jgi:GTP cyclohydrolase I
MKESTLVNMKHDMGKLAEAMHNTIRDLVGINTLVQGLLETVKRMPGYEEAIAEILANYKEEESESKLEL